MATGAGASTGRWCRPIPRADSANWRRPAGARRSRGWVERAVTDFRWALIGPGSIARRFAHAVRELPGTRLAAVIGRNEARARAFANEWCGAGPTRVGTDL